MKRNAVAWAALIVASAAFFSSTGFLRQMPAAPKVTEEGQRTAKALSQAFGAVAEFVRPSVVQIGRYKEIASIYPQACVDSRFPTHGACRVTQEIPAATWRKCCGSFSVPSRAPRRSSLVTGRAASDRGSSTTIKVTS